MTAYLAQDLILALPNAVLLIGPDDRVLVQNDAMTTVLGLDLTGRHHITALRQPATIEAIAVARETGAPQSAIYLPRVADTERSYAVAVTPQADHVLVALTDQTDKIQTNTLRRDFVANVSHELRTPLTALLGFIETLQGPARDDPKAQARFLDIMATEADRMRRLVDDLLSLSRVEDTQRIRPTAPVSLGVVVRQAVELLQDVAANNDTALHVTIPDDLPMIPGDEGQLQQVVNNLIENAIKYGASADGINITITGPIGDKSLRQDVLGLSVQDFGEGIASHHLARLTERFYRVDGHRAREQGGTGLGLAIVKHITNRHRGRLKFESEPGKGTTVTLRLPVRNQCVNAVIKLLHKCHKRMA